ncbi:WxL domain-containing protein [Enterococcus silesiacus]|nr:WxL domain-containing protein [Enterococcus silesiacus]
MSLKQGIMAGMLAVSLLAANSTVLAAETTTGNDNDGTKATSHGHIDLKPNEGKESPEVLVPEEEKTEAPDTETPSTGNKGPLTIDAISALEFGAFELSGTTEVYSVTNQVDGIKSKKVQVTDRRGTGAGWNLQVKSSEFADKTDAKKILKGATLSFPIGRMDKTEGNTSAEPKKSEVTLITGNSELDSFMKAEAGAGLGSWMNVMNSSEVEIKVPAGNLAGDYSATLEWSLISVPTAEEK